MSRSNPTTEQANPCTRWFEWNGETGEVKYYDKDKKETIYLGNKFTFMVLDSLSVIKGWHEPSQSGITSNEIRDTRTDVLTVRSFKGGELAEGLYADIKDRVNRVGGNYTTNLYIAYRDADTQEMRLGSIQFKGANLGAWMEFQKNHRKDIEKKAVKIEGYTEGQKGRVIYRMPAFKIVEISDETNEQATEIDRDILQPYLESYLKRGPVREGSTYEQNDAFAQQEAKRRESQEALDAECAPRSNRPAILDRPEISHDPDEDIDKDDIPW